MVRRLVLSMIIVLVSAAPAGAAERPAPPYSNADYWAFADSVMERLDSWWDADHRAYILRGTPSVRVNSALLLTHAIAAHAGHDGDTRKDARARLLVDQLTSPPAWLGAIAAGPLSTCWSRDLDRVKRQHASLEPKVAEALAWAWRARAELGLSTDAVRRIEREVTTCARSAAWDHVRVENQINWNAEMYAAAATVSGRARLLRRKYRPQLARFAADRSNFGHDFEFHYLPGRSATAAINLDAPEYANIVVHALGHYDRAVRLGMRPLPTSSMHRMRAWVTRLLAGSWTHGGYLNWDTGKGRGRWHSAQYWAFAQQGLLAIATSPRFWRRPAHGRWAKALFDRGLQLYGRRADAKRRAGAEAHVRRAHADGGVRLLLRTHGRERRAGRCARPRLAARRGPAAAVRLRPRHGSARDHDAALLDGDRARQPRGVQIRRHRPRAALRPGADGRRERGRDPTGGLWGGGVQPPRPCAAGDAAHAVGPAAAGACPTRCTSRRPIQDGGGPRHRAPRKAGCPSVAHVPRCGDREPLARGL
jgi:hypothetical protein